MQIAVYYKFTCITSFIRLDFHIYSIIAITLRLIQSIFLIVRSKHYLTMAYNFHTSSKHYESILLKIFCHVLNCQQFLTCLQKLRRWHM